MTYRDMLRALRRRQPATATTPRANGCRSCSSTGPTERRRGPKPSGKRRSRRSARPLRGGRQGAPRTCCRWVSRSTWYSPRDPRTDSDHGNDECATGEGRGDTRTAPATSDRTSRRCNWTSSNQRNMVGSGRRSGPRRPARTVGIFVGNAVRAMPVLYLDRHAGGMRHGEGVETLPGGLSRRRTWRWGEVVRETCAPRREGDASNGRPRRECGANTGPTETFPRGEPV